MTASAKGSAKGEDVDFEGGLTLLSDRAYVEYEGTEYEVDPTTFGFVKSGFEQAQQQGGGSESNPADVTACQEAATGLKVGDFVDNLTNEGSADVDGTSTTKVSGDLDVGGRDRRDHQADRKPGLQQPARSGRPAADRRTRRGQGRTDQRRQEGPRRRSTSATTTSSASSPPK